MQVKSEINVGRELSEWRLFLSRSTFWLGIWLLGAAVICAVAANWERLSTVQRFAGAQGLLALCALAAAWTGWRWRASQGPQHYGPQALLALAGLLLGALLALLGQTYQTGADTWQLFALWGILLLPWALVAMSQAVWLIWMVVLNIAALLYIQESSVFLLGLDSSEPVVWVGLLNVLFLVGWEYAARRWQASTVIGVRVLVMWLIALQVVTLFFDYSAFYGLYSVLGIFWIVTTIGLVFYYQRVRLDLVALAVLAAGVIVMSLRVVGGLAIDSVQNEWVALPIAGLLLGEAVWTAGWLRRLSERSASTADGHAKEQAADRSKKDVSEHVSANVQRDNDSPWYVQALLALAAWIATLLILFFVIAVAFIDSSEGAVLVGLLLCAGALGGLRVSKELFARQCLTALAFAGQLLFLGGLLIPSIDSQSEAGLWLYVLILGAVVYAFGSEVLLRFLSACLMAVALGALVIQQLVPGVMHFEMLFDWLSDKALSATFVWLPVAVIGAWVAGLAFYTGYSGHSRTVGDLRSTPEQGGIEALRPLAWAFALAVQSMVWLAGGLSIGQIVDLGQASSGLAAVMLAGVLLPAVCALALLWPRRHVLTSSVVWGVPFGLLVLAGFWLPSPGVAFALTWMLLGFGLRDLRLMVVGAISLLVYLITYYYQLQVPLLDKAIWLGGAAALLFLLRALVYLLPRWMRTIEVLPPQALPPATSALKSRTAVIVGGLLLILGVVNYAIWQREALLEHGKIVILELAPVDPRSLMQGDYMALRFAAGENLVSAFGVKPEVAPSADGYVVLVSDSNGVAQRVRIQDDVLPLSGNEIALRYRIRDRDVRIVTNAYFFPEGKAAHYEQARYGEVRVGEDGTGLLVRMLGADKQPL